MSHEGSFFHGNKKEKTFLKQGGSGCFSWEQKGKTALKQDGSCCFSWEQKGKTALKQGGSCYEQIIPSRAAARTASSRFRTPSFS